MENLRHEKDQFLVFVQKNESKLGKNGTNSQFSHKKYIKYPKIYQRRWSKKVQLPKLKF